MSENTNTSKNSGGRKPIRGSVQNVFNTLGKITERIYQPFLDSFLPKPHYLEEETIQRVIRMSSYRAKVPQFLGIIGIVLLIPSLIGLLITFLSQSDAGEMVTSGSTIVSLLLLFESAQSWLSYNQWQFILTDKRIILVTPDPDRKGFADAIYLKRGKIQVLDTNYSKNPVWGLFQILQGSRDVMLSMGGYEFQEQGAKVKGGLRFPDVKPDDISHLEALIFG